MSTVLPRARYVRAIVRFNARLTTGLTTLGGVSLLGLGTLAQLPSHGHAEPALAAASIAPAGDAAAPLTSAESQTVIAACAQALAEADRILSGIDALTATLEKRERVKGQLLPTEHVRLKIRREPMSVFMSWKQPADGQEVLWQENARGGLIYVHPGGFRGKLMPLVKISPDSAQVRDGSRRPINEVGLWAFNVRLRAMVDEFKASPTAQAKVDESATIGGRVCTAYRLVRTDGPATKSPVRLRVFIDREYQVPVAAESHVLKGGGEPVLDEYYAYYDLKLAASLSDRDFDPQNSAYHFGK